MVTVGDPEPAGRGGAGGPDPGTGRGGAGDVGRGLESPGLAKPHAAVSTSGPPDVTAFGWGPLRRSNEVLGGVPVQQDGPPSKRDRGTGAADQRTQEKPSPAPPASQLPARKQHAW